MGRYDTANVLKRMGEKRRLSTVIIPTIPRSDQDIYIETTSPERLDKLANNFYGDAKLWWIIAVNNKIKAGSIYVPSYTIIRIPPKESVEQFINQTNQSR
jgi:hypothetical protein